MIKKMMTRDLKIPTLRILLLQTASKKRRKESKKTKKMQHIIRKKVLLRLSARITINRILVNKTSLMHNRYLAKPNMILISKLTRINIREMNKVKM